jgi:hypothetical protein
MAYAATFTVSERQINGEAYAVVALTETGVTGATDEKEITGLPALGTVVYVKSVLAAGGGTATTVDPQLGETTNTDTVWAGAAAAATVREADLDKRYYSSGRSLFWQSNANGTADTITSTIVIKAGHHP